MRQELKSEKIRNALKKQNRILYFTIFFLVLTLGFGIWAYFEEHSDLDTAISLHKAIYDGVGEDEYVELTITDKPYSFALYDNDYGHKYYFLYDDDYSYVGYLSTKEADRLSKIDYSKEKITLKGTTKKIPYDIKNIGIKAYKEWYGNDAFKEATFDDYFGKIYIDTVTPLHDATLQYVLLVISLILAFVFALVYFLNRNRTKKTISKFTQNELDDICREVEAENVFALEKELMYFTDKYIVNVSNGLDIMKYSDIIWVYPYELKQHGITTSKSIVIYTNDKVKHMLANFNAVGKKSKKKFDEVFVFIAEKNPGMLVGFTKENRKEMKSLYNIK